MPELWNDESDLSGFALPGDDAVVASLDNSEPEEAAPVENTEGASAQEVPAVEDRQRDEKGRFVSKEQPAEEPQPAAEEVAPEPELILGKFKSSEDVIAAYQHLEQDRGRLANEVGELRRMVEERLAAPPVQPATTFALTQDFVEQNPAQAAQLAYEQGNEMALQAAFSYWKEEDPATAGAWAATKAAEHQMKKMRDEYEARLAQFEQRLAPAASVAQEQTRANEIRALVQQVPDIGEFVQSGDIATLAQEFPRVGNGLVSANPAEQVESIKTLYAIHRGRLTENLEQATRETARATAEEAQKAREEAFVASPSATAGTVKPSPAELLAAQWDARERPYKNGWNI